MRRWAWRLSLVMAVGMLAVGCKSSTNVTISLTPASATVLVGTTAQFSATVSNGGAVNWSVNGVLNGNTSIGTISTSGLYTAPLSVPSTTVVPTITVAATLQSDSNIDGSATITLDSGVRVTITPTSFTLGTGETFQFSAVVTGVPTNASITDTCEASTSPPSTTPYCTAVTWSISPAAATNGTISTNGLYTAPATATTTIVIATSIFDPTRTASASINIVTATPPTLTSISPTTAARGELFQDVYLAGTNFLSTTNVFVNGLEVPSTNVLVPAPGLTTVSAPGTGALMHIRLPDVDLTAAPTPPATVATLTFSVEQQGVTTAITCATCKLSLEPVRPAVVGTSPDSIPQGTGSPVGFNVNGGFFGTTLNPTVTAEFAGNEAKFPIVSSTNSTRQLTVTIGGTGSAGDVSTPGLFPVAISSNINAGAVAVANVAIQPSYPASSINQLAQFSKVGTNVGSSPTAVAINTATGLAVIASQASNDLELIDLTQPTPAVVGFICTGASGAVLTATEAATCPAAGPVSVAIDNVSNLAVIANAATDSIAVVNLAARSVSGVVPVPTNNSPTPPAPYAPAAVGINPVNHRAVVAYQSTNAASILDLTQAPSSPQFFVGVVNISTGPNARVTVSPRLDWALVTPGGIGSLSIVDLARQSTNVIAAPSGTSPGASRTSGIVTITTTTTHSLQVGEPVVISGVGDPSFDGVYTVVTVPSSDSFTYTQANFTTVPPNSTSGGGSISYAQPVATLATSLTLQGAALNDQTQKAILTDPGVSGPGTVFNAVDQSSTTIPLTTTNTADASFNLGVAVNPLANLGVVVNETTGDALLIDPNAPAVINTIPAVGVDPVDVAIDPGSNIAVFANRGAPASISIYSLGALRPLEVLQASVTSPNPCSPTATTPNPIFDGPTVLVCSTFPAQPQTLTILGSGFTANSTARLDGQVLATNVLSSRVLTATVSLGFQSAPRRYSLDVANSGVISNSTSFSIVQTVNLLAGAGNNNSCSTPSPQGVAIDPQLDLAVVTDSGLGCNQVYLINLANGTLVANGVVPVGTDPQGVAVFPLLGVAVVANEGSNSASVVNEIATDVAATVTTDSDPSGVAIDQDLGEALVTAAGANVADEFPITEANGNSITAGSSSSITVQQEPTAVAVDSVTHFAAVGNVASSDVTVVSLNQTSANSTTTTIQIPQGIALDPCPASACNANSEFLPNPNFLITASLENQVEILDPTTGVLTPLRVGINPTALAYNVFSSTLVTMNQLSNTMTVVDYLARQVRAVFPITPSNQFGVAIHPQSNLAVVADPTNSRVLLLPLPQ